MKDEIFKIIFAGDFCHIVIRQNCFNKGEKQNSAKNTPEILIENCKFSMPLGK